MAKNNGEVSVFFSVPEEVLNEFNEALQIKSRGLGVVLNKKQAYQLALKEITEHWKKEKPESK